MDAGREFFIGLKPNMYPHLDTFYEIQNMLKLSNRIISNFLNVANAAKYLVKWNSLIQCDLLKQGSLSKTEKPLQT